MSNKTIEALINLLARFVSKISIFTDVKLKIIKYSLDRNQFLSIFKH